MLVVKIDVLVLARGVIGYVVEVGVAAAVCNGAIKYTAMEANGDKAAIRAGPCQTGWTVPYGLERAMRAGPHHTHVEVYVCKVGATCAARCQVEQDYYIRCVVNKLLNLDMKAAVVSVRMTNVTATGFVHYVKFGEMCVLLLVVWLV